MRLGNRLKAVRRIEHYRLHKGIRRGLPQSFTRSAQILITCSVLVASISIVSVGRSDSHTDDQMQATGAYSRQWQNARQSQSRNSRSDVLDRISKPPAITSPGAIPSPLATPPVVSAPPANTAGPDWAKLPLFADPANEALKYAKANPTADGAALIKRAGGTPITAWFGDWNPNPTAAVNSYVSAATQTGTAATLVLYNIPERDCGLYSAGGVADTAAYLSWIRGVAAGISNRTAMVILEPDALAGLDCLSSVDQANRYGAMSLAVAILKANPNTSVYLDAGNPAWQSAATMASRLRLSNIAQADGFALNVSNYISTAKNQTYGDQISKLISNKHYVIDTSRNGNDSLSPDSWCNNMAAALGDSPTTDTGHPLNDALLWVKVPWESDGSCNGGPNAGTVYWQFIVTMARNAGWK